MRYPYIRLLPLLIFLLCCSCLSQQEISRPVLRQYQDRGYRIYLNRQLIDPDKTIFATDRVAAMKIEKRTKRIYLRHQDTSIRLLPLSRFIHLPEEEAEGARVSVIIDGALLVEDSLKNIQVEASLIDSISVGGPVQLSCRYWDFLAYVRLKE